MQSTYSEDVPLFVLSSRQIQRLQEVAQEVPAANRSGLSRARVRRHESAQNPRDDANPRDST